MYINDIHNALALMNVIHFADDSTLYMRFNKTVNVSDQINSELNSVNVTMIDWLSTNTFYLNSIESKYMIFSNKYKTSTLNIKIGTTFIEKTAAHKFLGIIIDENMNFSKHVHRICAY